MTLTLHSIRCLNPDPPGVKRVWSADEVAYMRRNYRAQSAKVIAWHLGRTELAVRTRAVILGLARKRDGV